MREVTRSDNGRLEGMKDSRPGLLLVANYDSGVGYAWWLMEGFWCVLARRYSASHEVLLAYPSISRIPDAVAAAPLRAVLARFDGRGLRDLVDQIRFLQRNRIRLIYLTDQELVHWRYFVYRLFGVRKIIVHDHSPGLRVAPRGIKKFLKTLVARTPWITADAVLGASEFVSRRHVLVNRMPSQRCYVVANGIHLQRRDGPVIDVHKEFAIPPERKLIVSSGRAHRIKGVPFAIDCMRALIHERKRTDVHFLYCGDGPHLESFVELARRLGVEKFVTFPGRQEVVKVLPSCHIAFHPSEGEVGYSLSILEYMEFGLPVVVPDNPSVCGATRDGCCGLHYRDRNVESAVVALERLLNDENLRVELGRHGREIVRSEFSLDSTHNALLEAFSQIDPMPLS
jgi:glycosyltransferase involved in cell wall biosynthesis